MDPGADPWEASITPVVDYLMTLYTEDPDAAMSTAYNLVRAFPSHYRSLAHRGTRRYFNFEYAML